MQNFEDFYLAQCRLLNLFLKKNIQRQHTTGLILWAPVLVSCRDYAMDPVLEFSVPIMHRYLSVPILLSL